MNSCKPHDSHSCMVFQASYHKGDIVYSTPLTAGRRAHANTPHYACTHHSHPTTDTRRLAAINSRARFASTRQCRNLASIFLQRNQVPTQSGRHTAGQGQPTLHCQPSSAHPIFWPSSPKHPQLSHTQNPATRATVPIYQRHRHLPPLTHASASTSTRCAVPPGPPGRHVSIPHAARAPLQSGCAPQPHTHTRCISTQQ